MVHMEWERVCEVTQLQQGWVMGAVEGSSWVMQMLELSEVIKPTLVGFLEEVGPNR